MEYYFQGIQNMFNFYGRTTRREYWMFQLLNIIMILILIFLTVILNFRLLINLYYIFICFAQLSISVRRLHDINKSGWNILFSIIPLFGNLYFIYLTCKPSSLTDNTYPHAAY